MPAFTDPYRNSRQPRDSVPSSLSISGAPIAQNNPSGTITGAAGTAFVPSRPRIYPREFNIRNPQSPRLSSTTSPLLSALQNPSDLLSRSIPFSQFRAGSSPSSGAPNSLGSASGGVGLSGGPSPPPSAPASYSSGGGFSVPRQIRGYPGFEEQYSGPYGSSAGGYYSSTQRSTGGQINGTTHVQSGDSNYACELSTIDELGFGDGNPRSSGGHGTGGDNIVSLGWDGGVDIWRIGRNTVEQIGRLEGLRGSVKSAKILPNPPLNDPLASHRPLICLTVHSPIFQGSGSDADPEAPISLDADSPYSTSPPSRPETSNSHRSSQNSDLAPDWQTTVEIWSLSTRTRLCKLFTSPLIPTADHGFGRRGPPPVWGNLRVQVTADKVVMGVGSSGEIYVFGVEGSPIAAKKSPMQEKVEWKCLDKVWTSVQYPQGSSEVTIGTGFEHSNPGIPVFALSDRWLAYCPASMGAISAGGEVGVRIMTQSVLAAAPPSQPQISAALSLEDESFLNKMARDVAQELIKTTKWAADVGYKKIQGYMNPNGNSPPLYQSPIGIGMAGVHQPNGSVQGGYPQQPSGLGQQLRQMQEQPDGQQILYQPQTQQAHEPRLVSLIDLQKSVAARQEGAPPMATFLPPDGVSFLSFAPGGLSLLTASSKGDVLSVWDLLKVVHHPPGHQRTGPNSVDSGAAHSTDTLGRHVRQIARFTRMTVATVVEVDWFAPRGEKIAVITEKGTAHFYDLPYSALQWPPPRRPPPSSAAVGPQTTAARAVVSKMVNQFNSSTQPLLTAARRRSSRSSSVGSPGNGMFGSPSTGRRPSGAPGTSPNDPLPGGNRVYLASSGTGVQPGCVKFLTGKERGYVAVLGGGLLRIYELRPGGSGKKGSTTGGVASGNWWEYDLPGVPSTSEHTTSDYSDGKAGGYWGFRSHWARNGDDDNHDSKTPLAWAEIETNSAFVPWHQERRVKMFVYDPPTYNKQQVTRLPTPPPEPKVEPPPPAMFTHANMLSPSPITWDSEDDAARGESSAPTKKKGKKPKKLRSAPTVPDILSPALDPVPEPERPLVGVNDVSPIPVMAPPSPPAEKWVFGLPMDAERIFLSDAGGRGDVTFCDDGTSGLEAAMRDGLQIDLDAMRGHEEGFFEEDAEMLVFEGV